MEEVTETKLRVKEEGSDYLFVREFFSKWGSIA